MSTRDSTMVSSGNTCCIPDDSYYIHLDAIGGTPIHIIISPTYMKRRQTIDNKETSTRKWQKTHANGTNSTATWNKEEHEEDL